MKKEETKVVYLLGATSLINDFASEGIFSALPYYIPSMQEMGFISGIIHGLPYIFIPFFGFLAEKVKKIKKFLLGGYGLSAISKFLIAVAPKKLLWGFIILDRAGKAIRTAPRDYLLAKIKEHGLSFGIHRALDTLGAMLGVLFAYLLLKATGNPKVVILFCGAAALLSLVPILLLRDEEYRKKDRIGFEVNRTAAIGILIGLASISPVFLLDIAKKAFAVEAILLYFLFNIFHILSSRYLNPLGDKMSKTDLLTAAFLGNAFIFFLFAKGYYLFALPLYGIVYGLLKPLGPSIVADVAPKPSVIGFYHFLYGLSVLAISALAGIAVDIMGNVFFLYVALAMVLFALAAKVFLRYRRAETA